MTGIPNAGILADHAAFPDLNPGHGDKMNSGREHDIVPDFNETVLLRLQMYIRIKQNVLPKSDVARPLYLNRPQDNHRFVHWRG